jgi:hypothetical protein
MPIWLGVQENNDGENEMTVIDERREAVALHESKLAAAKRQRDTILIDKRVAEARADKGDQPARMEVARLGKQDLELGRLVLSIERQLKEAKRWLAFAENQAATAAATRASVDDTLVRDKLFECICPDGRKVRHRGASQEDVQRRLQPGYSVTGQIFGANADGTGGFVSSPGAPSMLKALLDSQGDELIAFLAERGIKSITA